MPSTRRLAHKEKECAKAFPRGTKHTPVLAAPVAIPCDKSHLRAPVPSAHATRHRVGIDHWVQGSSAHLGVGPVGASEDGDEYLSCAGKYQGDLLLVVVAVGTSRVGIALVNNAH